jgi:ribonucleotide monophosphatase NagD (HAD superfamily)
MHLLGDVPRARVAAIGDGLRTDIAGARAAGILGVLVTGGINAEALGIVHGDTPDPQVLAALCETAGSVPDVAIPALRW